MHPLQLKPKHRLNFWVWVTISILSLPLALQFTAAWTMNLSNDSGLTQTINPEEPIMHGNYVINHGHIDMGPRFDGSSWRFLIRDDSNAAEENSQNVWRHPEETVLHIVDTAQLVVPNNDNYSFLGVDPGATVWVVPQTQKSGVVWLGWNTQDPNVMTEISLGATFSVNKVQGPGIMNVYLQSGDFGAPQVLWDSRKDGDQPVFVETNTHTHANWVFTKPGVYLVQMTVSANLVDGSTVSDTGLLRFAVGSDTATDVAFTANIPAAAKTPNVPLSNENQQNSLILTLIFAIILVTLTLTFGFTLTIVRGKRAKQKVLTMHKINSNKHITNDVGNDS